MGCIRLNKLKPRLFTNDGPIQSTYHGLDFELAHGFSLGVDAAGLMNKSASFSHLAKPGCA